MAQIRGMIAATLDGYAADAAGGVDWLMPWHEVDYGYDDFAAQIGTVVMGRKTYQQLGNLSPVWPYPGKRAIVVGRGLTTPLDGGAQVWTGGLADLITELRARPQDSWVVGGPTLQSAFLDAGALDRLELAVVPHLMGAGIALFAGTTSPARQPELADVRRYDKGLVILDYRFGAPGRGGVAL